MPPESVDDGSSPFSVLPSRGKHRFTSYRLKGGYEKPWLADARMTKTKWNNVIVALFIVLGFLLAGMICFLMVRPYLPGPVSFLPWL